MAANKMFDIAGKHAIVSGGAQGLSRGMAEGLLEDGCKVVIMDLQKEKLEKVCADYRAQGYEAYPVVGNLADRADLNRMFDEALEILDGRLDILIPAAGVQRRYLPEESREHCRSCSSSPPAARSSPSAPWSHGLAARRFPHILHPRVPYPS